MKVETADVHGRLTEAQYWHRRHAAPIRQVDPDAHLEPYLRDVLPFNSDWSCLEIGVVPGSLLLWMAQSFGYRPCGVDFSERINELETTFRQQGLEARLYHADFLNWRPSERFNVVFSVGFVEHFVDYAAVILRHWELLIPGGYMVISTPSWSPAQRWIRRIVYTRQYLDEIKSSHNIGMMNLSALRAAVRTIEGCEIILARYIREMTVWIEPGQTGVRRWTAPLFPPIRFLEKFFRLVRVSSRLFSPEILVVARKEATKVGRVE